MILLIDNYDSFSYNLYQLIGSIDDDIKVVRNDELTVDEVGKLKPDHIFISPGPGRPEDAGICVDVIKKYAGLIPIMGICLGHQAICLAFGGVITYAKELMHGKTSEISVDTTDEIYKGLPEKIPVARYHSLVADPETLPDCLKVTAETQSKEIMSVKHKELPVYGLQYHPESVLTKDGRVLIENFLNNNR